MTASPTLEILLVCSIALILLAIAVLIAAKWLAGPRNKIGEKFYASLSFLGWVLIVGGIVGSLCTPWALISIPWWIGVICVVAESTRQHRRAQQHALLWSMAIAAEKNIPLVEAIEAFARERVGLINIKAQKLAALLRSGVALPEAMARVPGLLPPRVLPMLRVGYESGALAKSLRQVVSSRDELGIIWNSLFTKLLYIALVISFGVSILVFMMIWIVPRYHDIFHVYRTPFPAITQSLMETSDFMVNFWPLFALLYLLLIGFIIYLLVCYLRPIPFYLPGMAKLFRRRHAAVILDSLAMAAEYQRPLGGSISLLAASYPERAIRHKLDLVGQDVAQGVEWSESLRRRGLIKSADKAVLQAAQRVGNLPWAMREMADSNRRRLAYRLNALVQLAYPPIILCLGALVMFVVVALFCPLISLIARLAGR